ncbi:MAG: hypoxanthine-guanine phosphoribosyltransferase [Gammaproteobacteria bacterium]|nr:hypoxanthine-guanine phosphoribosyltransferase [Gammaproteobacteria bacterium]
MSKQSQEAKAVFERARCLYDAKAVSDAVVELANEITSELEHSNPIVIAIMNGGLIPAGMILSHLNFPLQCDYLHASRYRGETSGGKLNWVVKPQTELKDRVVLIIDDILDEGITLKTILDYCNQQGASKVYSCVLVEKLHNRKTGCEQANFVGLRVEDVYVFGCGMDYKGYLRNAAGIYAVED